MGLLFAQNNIPWGLELTRDEWGFEDHETQ